MASVVDCNFTSSLSCSLGMRVPRKSAMYLSTFGGLQEARSGLGCSLNVQLQFIRKKNIFAARLVKSGYKRGCTGMGSPSKILR